MSIEPTRFTGIIPILVTPFRPDGSLDTDSLRNLVEYNIGARVHIPRPCHLRRV